MKKKITKFINKFDFPENINKGFYIEIFSENEINITGEISIEQMEKEIIQVNCNDKHISVNGDNLIINFYDVNGIRINGKIKKLEFSGKG